MKLVLLNISLLFLTLGCMQAPTKSIEESAQIFDKNTVLIDTRSPLQFESFHIEGSRNLWWEEFLLLKDPKRKTRVFDPDLEQTVERLAKLGIAPSKTIYLIGDKANSLENKKWKWLLGYLEVGDVQLKALESLTKNRKGSINRFALPEPQKPWKLLTSEDFQNELLKRKIPQCFVKWNENLCL